MDQAGMTANHYLREVRKGIDEEFGAGYAIKNPGLVAAMVNCAARDFQTSTMFIAIQDYVGPSLDDIAQALTREP